MTGITGIFAILAAFPAETPGFQRKDAAGAPGADAPTVIFLENDSCNNVVDRNLAHLELREQGEDFVASLGQALPSRSPG